MGYITLKLSSNEELKNEKSLSFYKMNNGDMILYSYSSVVMSKQDKELEKQKQKNSNGIRQKSVFSILEENSDLIIRIKKQINSPCGSILVDHNSGLFFERFCRLKNFPPYFGYLYGKMCEYSPKSIDDDRKVEEKDQKYMEKIKFKKFFKNETQFIYEPKQELKKGFCVEKRDVYKNRVNKIANLFNLQCLGWIISKKNGKLDSKDCRRMAKLQNVFGDHFVTVLVFPQKDNPSLSDFVAFQVTQQFCDLVKARLVKKNSKDTSKIEMLCPVKIVNEMKKSFDLSWIITKVPIMKCKSFFYMGYEPRNRRDMTKLETVNELKLILNKRRGLNFAQKIADFHLLLCLTDFFSIDSDFPIFAEAIKEPRNWALVKQYETFLNKKLDLFC